MSSYEDLKKNFNFNDEANIRWSSFENVIIKNPQIRSIDLYDPHQDFLHNMSVLLPKLEHLTLSRYDLKNVSIEFKNVTTFVVNNGYNRSPENFHFPRLQTLHIDTDWYPLFYKWVNFLNEHKQLSQLQLRHFGLDDLQFKHLTSNLTNLVEITLWAKYSETLYVLSTDCIVEFVKSHEQLKILNIFDYPKQCERELQYQLKLEWNMQIVDRGLSFERKIFKAIVDK